MDKESINICVKNPKDVNSNIIRGNMKLPVKLDESTDKLELLAQYNDKWYIVNGTYKFQYIILE
jgi:hypothetical protein